MNIVIQASECPYCGTDIPTSAVKCSHCGEWLNERGDKGFLDWYFGYIYFCHYADFRGRLSRGHYWAGLAFCLVISGLLRVLDFWIIMVTLLPVTISSLFIGLMMLVRVLLPTWEWLLINFIPFIGSIWYFILMLMPSPPPP